MARAMNAGKSGRACRWAAGLAIGWAAVGPVRAQAPAPPGAYQPLPLHAAIMRSSLSGVNETDAMAALNVFVRRMGEKRGYALTPHIHVLDNAAALADYLRAHPDTPIDLAILDSWDYLAFAPIANLPPAFATVEQDAVLEEYLVLVRKDSGLAGLADLAGKRVLVLRSSNANTVGHWFRTEIRALGRGAPEDFLGQLEVRHQLSQTVLPVFFGKADACVVDREGFATMSELNPQIAETLQVLVASEPFLDTLACVRLDGWEEADQRQKMLDAMLEMPDDPAGRQILTLFKFNGMAPFEDRYLDSMRALRQRAAELDGAIP